jgi:hypothetical protein
MGPLAIFSLFCVLMVQRAGEIAVYGPSGFFPLWYVLMVHCAGEIAIYGPSGYFSFMVCANGPLCR